MDVELGPVTLGDLAGMVAALAFAFLVFRVGSLIGKAGRILDDTRVSLRTTSDNVQPTLVKLTDTVSLTNDQIARVDGITANVSHLTTNASALTALFAATLGGPLVKVAAFSYGVRAAAAGWGRDGGRHAARGARQARGTQDADHQHVDHQDVDHQDVDHQDKG